MSSVKSRAALAGGKYLVTHPRGRIARWAFRFTVRRAAKKLVTASHVAAIPRSRAFRIVVVGWIATLLTGAAVLGGVVTLVVRRRRRRAAARDLATPVVTPEAVARPERVVTPVPNPTPSAPDTRTAPSAAAPAPGVAAPADAELVARVEETLMATTPSATVRVEATAGVITLHGRVADEEAESRVVKDAEQVAGVKAVQSELQTAGAEPGSSLP